MTSPRVTRRPIRLSGRERDVLVGLAEGLRIAEIAARHFIAPGTAAKAAQRMYARIGARSQAHAVALAYEAGILPVRDHGATVHKGET